MIYNFFSDDESIDALVNSTKIDRYVPDTELEIRQIINGVVIPQVGVFEGRKFLPNSYWGGDINEGEIVLQEFDYDDSEVYYLGTFHPCWGHEITDGVRLLWGLIREINHIKIPNDIKFVYTLRDNNKQLNQNFKELLSYFGAADNTLLCVDKPTQFKKIYLADESYWYNSQSDAKRKYSNYFTYIFDYLTKQIVPENNKPNKVVYFSRTAWKKGNPDFGEKFIEDAFVNSMHCEIVHPERLSFVEMVRLLQNTQTLITTEGSISHNALFMQNGTDLIIIRKAGFISYYQLMINQVKNLNVTYIDAHFTHYFYDKTAPYYGPFFLYVNKSLALYLGIRSHFPVLTYCRYRSHIIFKSFRYFLICKAIKLRNIVRNVLS